VGKPMVSYGFSLQPSEECWVENLRLSGIATPRWKLNESDGTVDTSATSSTSPNDQTKTMDWFKGKSTWNHSFYHEI
jgi:hypothetical protein